MESATWLIGCPLLVRLHEQAAFQSNENVRLLDEWLSGIYIFSKKIKQKTIQSTVQEVNAI